MWFEFSLLLEVGYGSPTPPPYTHQCQGVWDVVLGGSHPSEGYSWSVHSCHKFTSNCFHYTTQDHSDPSHGFHYPTHNLKAYPDGPTHGVNQRHVHKSIMVCSVCWFTDVWWCPAECESQSRCVKNCQVGLILPWQQLNDVRSHVGSNRQAALQVITRQPHELAAGWLHQVVF